MARDAGDLALALDVIAGPDERAQGGAESLKPDDQNLAAERIRGTVSSHRD